MANTFKEICNPQRLNLSPWDVLNEHSHWGFEHHSIMFLLSSSKFQFTISASRALSPAHYEQVHLLALYKTYKSVGHPTLYVCDLVDFLLILGRSTGADALKKKVVTHN